MEMKPGAISDYIVRIAVGLMIAAGIIIAAMIFSNAIADRPIVGSFNGNISQGVSEDNDLMDIDTLRYYLSIYPTETYGDYTIDEEGNITDESGESFVSYHDQDAALKLELIQNITGGAWTGFPYVKLGDRLYFSRKAIDEWFYTQSKAQLSVK